MKRDKLFNEILWPPLAIRPQPQEGGGGTGNFFRNNVQYKLGSNIFIVDKFVQNVHVIKGILK